ncbi:hypothetical protein BJ508DRAFT_417221 [Ascobolus immersus RN42]|uniref:Uncharacterized protein n=1 Tax=Ascobolus immersus RN42 TaxID=1160509 RepID=A0A3N4HTP8_ASCIM|nr:hypothetical protein BJ508DRAFT_417221 [Ascobolus immersus RN42]
MRFDIPLHLSSLLLLFTSRAIAVAVPAPDRLHSPDDGPTKLSNTCPASGKREICKDPIFFPTIYRNVGWPFANCEDFLAQFSKEHVKDTGDVHYFDFERLARPDPKGIGAEMVAKIRELLQGVDVKEVVRMNKVLHDPYFGCRFNLSDLTVSACSLACCFGIGPICILTCVGTNSCASRPRRWIVTERRIGHFRM